MFSFSIKGMFFAMIALHGVLLGIYYSRYDEKTLPPSTQTKLNTIQTSQTVSSIEKLFHTFDRHNIALILLKQLDVSSVMNKEENPREPKAPLYGFGKQDNYCENHRANFIRDPEIVFSKNVFISDSGKNRGPRQAFKSMNAVDLSPDAMSLPQNNVEKMKDNKYEIYDVIKETNKEAMLQDRGLMNPEDKIKVVPTNTKTLTKNQDDYLFEMTQELMKRQSTKFNTEPSRTDISLFYFARAPYKYLTVGKHFSCLSQASNHIPGREILYEKDQVGNALVQYSKSYLSRPQCFNFDKFFPQTWVLSKEDQCKDFFREFTSPKYEQLKKEKNIVYFRKKSGVHQGLGVFPVNEEQEKYLIENYNNGTECGKFTEANVMQNAIMNPLLLNGHKFHFRVYLLIASTNPLIAYYHDGYIRLSVNKYDPDSNDLDTFVTNLGITAQSSQKGRQNSPFQGMSDKEIKEATSWFYPQLQEYLLKEGIISDTNWLDNHLRVEFKKVMIHLVRMSQHQLFKQSSLFELYGLDFLMDENLDVWFIEVNAMPLLTGWSDKTEEFFNKLITDDFEIVLGLLRSRMKRVVLYINQLTKEIDDGTEKNDDYILPNLEARRKKFDEITKNYFEPEYEPSASNGFQKIVDENLEGNARYMGLWKQKCL